PEIVLRSALWYNMLCFMVYLANNMLDSVKHPLESEISLLRKAFRETFWNEKLGYLYDYVNDEEKNSLLRPNQIFAASLFFSPLTPKMISKVVAVIKEHLFTPYGLRTLAPKEPNYNHKYAGNYRERDLAYHNGVIWPWLLGHFGDALIKTTSDKKQLNKILKPIFETMQSHLFEAGIGTISEIFSEQDFISPDGCISQAWSVAEILRLTHLINR
ncbi:MAG: hypothetical protein M1561_05480, partial [Gammaproteobacteria bacterium]|nr:hypothetical protein [Gammaproteobacteria bacterium]